MSRRDDRVRLRHMIDAAREVSELLSTRTRADLDSDRLLGLGVVRLLEIVGEAAARVSEPTRAKIQSVPWHAIVGMRNRIIHGYDQVNFDIVWKTVREDLPPLIGEIEAHLGL